MDRSPFAWICNLRWSLLTCALFVAVGGVFRFPGEGLLSADQPPAKPNQKLDFKGTWDGTYVDDQGKTGKGTYKFHDEKKGRLKVTVSWGKYKMELEGERLGLDAMHLEGKDGDTTYRYIGRMEGSGLVLQYLSIDGKTGKSGSGVSKLTRQK